MQNDRRVNRDIYALDENGMVVCNPRDREAAHRAAVGDIVIAELGTITCQKCRDAMLKTQRDERGNYKQ